MWPRDFFLLFVGIGGLLTLQSGWAWATVSEEIFITLQRQGFWQSPQWLRLLHIPDDFPGRPSRIDNPDFFLISSVDPVAEGRAFVDLACKKTAEPVACRYPARFLRVNEALSGSGLHLPTAVCPEVDDWLARFQPEGLSLIQAEAALTNPASMFGHSFLRIISSRYHSPLLFPVIGFSATTADDRGLGYALRGLFGGYHGTFSIGRYAEMVRAYGALENRDIWEYQLDVTAEETRFLLLHVFELQHARYAYFFLHENCAFQLMTLLEAARPSLRLVNDLSPWVLPTDTVRVLDKQQVIVGGEYRPGRQARLQAMEKSLSRKAVDRAALLCHEEIEQLEQLLGTPESQEAAVLELALECRYQDQLAERGQEDPAGPEEDALLKALHQKPPYSWKGERRVRPDQGHASSRVQLRLGDDNGLFLEAGYRPALHGLLDPMEGYPDGATVELLQPWIRYKKAQERLSLERFRLLQIQSVSPVSRLVRPTAWKINIEARRIEFPGNRRSLVFCTEVGAGISFRPARDLLVFGMPEVMLAGSSLFTDNVRLAAGLTFGALATGTPWSLALTGKCHHFFGDSSEFVYEAGLRLSRQLRQDLVVFGQWGVKQEFDASHPAVLLGVSFYF